MLNNRLYGAALAAALVACPAAADETATPGSFSLPGTDTRIKPYGIAYLTGWFFRDQDLGDTGALVAGRTDPLNPGASPDRQFGMTARYSRFGLATRTPSTRVGAISTLLEIDFTKDVSKTGGLNLRHAYVTFGNWTLGHTWSNWLDVDATGETVDMNGPVGQACNGSGRFTQARYRFPLSKRSGLAFSVEQNRMGWGKFTDDIVVAKPDSKAAVPDARYPTLTGAYTFADDWGHWSLRAMQQSLGAYTLASGHRSDQWGGAVQLSGTVKLGRDSLVGSVYTGRGLGDYGVGIQAARYDSQNLLLFRNQGWQAGYTHTWTGRVRSNLVASGVSFNDNAAVMPESIKNSMNYFVNTFVKLSPSMELGMEYGYEDLRTFGAAAVAQRNGSHSDRNSSNKVQVSLTAKF